MTDRFRNDTFGAHRPARRSCLRARICDLSRLAVLTDTAGSLLAARMEKAVTICDCTSLSP
ncbi:MAG: hypothetical protein LPJ95_10715 [Paracoccaceae bacterium]|nr:hypothetical protein [Paracoccaceae bacterium]